ncbi:hypothetical protein [Clostridium perfringens]|uniref:hypothetical protein n=1 Tax=Clostridium perfringens TaxID=1502 RepID=UPI0028E0F57C|nr:hypothetical protein [Clostridium perfringens]MDT9331593.1 hypothetical protein [Clostridium perfringens]
MELKRNFSLIDILMFFIGLTSTMVILRISGISLFKIIVMISVAFLGFYYIMIKRKISISRIDKQYIYVYIVKIFTVIGAVYYSWGMSWKRAAVIQFIWFSLYTILYIFIGNLKDKSLKYFRKGLLLSIVIQIVWCFIQIMFNKFFSIDINTLIFTNILSMVSEASQIKFGILNISGLAWHPINMAPILIIAYCFSKNVYCKLIIVFIALTTNNSTILIGMTACIIMDIFFRMKYLKNNKKIIKYTTIFSVLLLIIILGFILIKTDIFQRLINNFVYLYERVSGKFYDGGSTAAHIRYYTSIPEMFSISSIYKILFGYGEGCSGYLMGVLFGQYIELSSWAMECDLVNILISNGVLGFLLFYSWLIKIAFNGLKINKNYFICIIAFVICGITYNIQFDWVVLFEMILAISIKANYNIFLNTNKESTTLNHEVGIGEINR